MTFLIHFLHKQRTGSTLLKTSEELIETLEENQVAWDPSDSIV